jgi:sensor histidine kinase regulating citrate/malate metabolism
MLIHLIDNAIEGTERIPAEDKADKIILLTMTKNESHYEIEIENPTDCQPIPSLEILLSDRNAGHGLKLVKKIVDDYEGVLNADQDEGYFIVCVRIPLKR